jgi:hypothetical protein
VRTDEIASRLDALLGNPNLALEFEASLAFVLSRLLSNLLCDCTPSAPHLHRTSAPSTIPTRSSSRLRRALRRRHTRTATATTSTRPLRFVPVGVMGVFRECDGGHTHVSQGDLQTDVDIKVAAITATIFLGDNTRFEFKLSFILRHHFSLYLVSLTASGASSHFLASMSPCRALGAPLSLPSITTHEAAATRAVSTNVPLSLRGESPILLFGRLHEVVHII